MDRLHKECGQKLIMNIISKNTTNGTNGKQFIV